MKLPNDRLLLHLARDRRRAIDPADVYFLAVLATLAAPPALHAQTLGLYRRHRTPRILRRVPVASRDGTLYFFSTSRNPARGGEIFRSVPETSFVPVRMPLAVIPSHGWFPGYR
jgi:hypothetical protein